jgi:hypothetical protein
MVALLSGPFVTTPLMLPVPPEPTTSVLVPPPPHPAASNNVKTNALTIRIRGEEEFNI